jgi:tetratricopeptide (TPR) repeat protein
LLLDENLSERLLPLLIERFPHSTHVRLIGLGGASNAATATLLLQQAERYFAYAELLSQQGSGDLAGALYRQAYVGLRAVFGVQGPPVVGLQQPVLPPSRTAPAAVQAPQGTDLERQLQPLKERLSSATAPEVEQQLLNLLRQGHRHEDLTNLLGLAALMQDRRDDAERWFRETLTLNPRHHRSLVNLGGLFLSTSRPEEAVQVLSRAIELIHPQAPEALAGLTNLSLAHQQLGRPMDAAQLALRIFRIKPDHLRPESLAAVSQTLEEMGDDQAAIELLQYLREVLIWRPSAHHRSRIKKRREKATNTS